MDTKQKQRDTNQTGHHNLLNALSNLNSWTRGRTVKIAACESVARQPARRSVRSCCVFLLVFVITFFEKRYCLGHHPPPPTSTHHPPPTQHHHPPPTTHHHHHPPPWLILRGRPSLLNFFFSDFFGSAADVIAIVGHLMIIRFRSLADPWSYDVVGVCG